MTLEYFRTLARYNQWANRRIYAACAQLSEAEHMKPRPAFFKSIHGTLNHILVGDRIWLGRFTGHPAPIASLDQILYGDFAGLKVAREAEDATIIRHVDHLDMPTLNSTLRFTTMDGTARSLAMRFALGHFFNHQTHHRGQAHGLLSATSVAPPPLDLPIYLYERESAGR